MCEIEGCGPEVWARGWCGKHYRRWYMHGTTDDPVRLTQEELFWAKVDKQPGEDSCWLWTASTNNKGYGSFGKHLAHRFAYELLVGPIPNETPQLDHRHTCPKNCVRPIHLRPTTQKQNQENRVGAQANNKSSGVRGVSWSKRDNKWFIQVGSNGVNHRGGLFDTIEEAEVAVIALRNQLHTHNDSDRISI